MGSTILQKDIVFHCSVDEIIRPTEMESRTRIERTQEMWTIFKTYVQNGDKWECRLCVGMAPLLMNGDELTLIGDLVKDDRYGLQFKFSGIQQQCPTERLAAIRFMTKNISGIGPKTAEKIVDKLGTNIVEKVRQDPKILETVEGISTIKANNIKEQLDAMESSLEDLQFFSKTGLGNSRILAVKTTYAKMSEKDGKTYDVIKIIKNNPYQLVDDVKGIGFKVADAVALNIGIKPEDPNRLKAGLLFTLKEEVEMKGNIWMDKEKLIKSASDKSHLHVSPLPVEDELNNLIVDSKLIQEENRIYLPSIFQIEKEIAHSLIRIQDFKSKPIDMENLESAITEVENEKNRILDDGQRQAVIRSTLNNLSIITGGPGCGKTTTLDILLTVLEKELDMKVTMVAPTGRAAKRMSEQTGRNASTIHSLSASKSRADFTMNGLERHVIVADESSMIDIYVMKMLLSLCDESTKLIFVGDVDQLPSIGPGQILRDMIDSNVITTSKLTKIHRQSADSHIITNAHLCISGKHLEKEGKKDFFIAERDSEEACLNSLKGYIMKTYPTQLGIMPEDIQVLAPLKRGLLGVNNLNKELQSLINPQSEDKKEVVLKTGDDTLVLREGDRVMQNKNDYSIPCSNKAKGVYNGEIGTISKIVQIYGETKIVVEYPDKLAFYDNSMLKSLVLSYAISIHKSQGSEFKTVIIPLYNYSMPTIYNRNLLYTAITRAKSYCCIIGQRTTTNKMIHNNKIMKRRTTLVKRLQELVH